VSEILLMVSDQRTMYRLSQYMKQQGLSVVPSWSCLQEKNWIIDKKIDRL
jgi:hypothetical protein